MALVKEVLPGSLAFFGGVKPGDVIDKINGEYFTDILEYKYLISEEELEIELIKPDGSKKLISIINDEYRDIGIVFQNPLISSAKVCSNKCIFCFIDQLPKNMRKTLYFKDDDSRLSFLQGNYITMTNMSHEDIKKLIMLRISPVNISVHTTNGDLRKRMLNNRLADRIMEQMKMLADAKIVMNCQIVCCRDINDGIELDKSIEELSELYPFVNSISVVPVGITSHREGLYSLKPYDKKSSQTLLRQVEDWQKKLKDKYGSQIIFPADELYVMAERDIPVYSMYENFPQLENGVGMLALLKNEFDRCFSEINNTIESINRNISIVTGISAEGFINSLTEQLLTKYPGLRVNVFAIKNNFFGEKVTVSGLITGKDIIEQLDGKDLGEEVLIPSNMLRNKEVFLDDVNVNILKSKLKTKITVVDNNGYELVNRILDFRGRNGV
jgi:putative radical SAM enzyme (TIGR03279 family)